MFRRSSLRGVTVFGLDWSNTSPRKKTVMAHYFTVVFILFISCTVSAVVQRVDNSSLALKRDQTNNVHPTRLTVGPGASTPLTIMPPGKSWGSKFFRKLREYFLVTNCLETPGTECDNFAFLRITALITRLLAALSFKFVVPHRLCLPMLFKLH